jgi:hypothetical protein
MFILQSIPLMQKTGWTNESIPMYKKQANALLKVRLANNTGKHRFRYRLIPAK